MILRVPNKEHVSGLTTAATIWLTALMGVACGAGAFAPVLIAFVLSALVIAIGGRLERALRHRFARRHPELPPPPPT